MFANVKKKIQQAKQNPVFLLCFSDTYPERLRQIQWKDCSP